MKLAHHNNKEPYSSKQQNILQKSMAMYSKVKDIVYAYFFPIFQEILILKIVESSCIQEVNKNCDFRCCSFLFV